MSQPPPVAREGAPRIAERVIDDIGERMRRGAREYGTALQAHNGRRALLDLYEELLDGAHYVKQRLDEEDQTLRDVVGDQAVRISLQEIYDRCELIRRNPNKVNQKALEQRYVDDIGYLRTVTEALLVELVNARQTPPDPPPLYEVVGYQYRVMGPDGKPEYDSTHDHNEIDAWTYGRYEYADGYYPEYRVLLAVPGWYRVDREKPLLLPPGGEYVPTATGATGDDGEPS